jgi:hypothetical protein
MRSATRKKTGKDPAYLEWVHTLPCVCCEKNIATHPHYNQDTKTESAHVGDRGLSQKAPDREAIPLCRIHHREGVNAIHRLGKTFWAKWNLNRDELIKELNRRFDEQNG